MLFENSKTVSKFTMLWLAIFPIMNIYKFVAFLSFAWMFFLVLYLLAVCKTQRIKIFTLPNNYLIYWGWTAVSLVISNNGALKITYLIPGGIYFCLFTAMLGFSIYFFDNQKFLKYYNRIVNICCIVIIIQFVFILCAGFHFSCILPFLPLMDDMPTSAIISQQLISDRVCAFFREPAHCAAYLLPALVIELFSSNNESRFYSKRSLFITAVLILLQSGVGLVGVFLVYIFKFVGYANKSMKKKLILFLVIVPIMSTITVFYLNTELGSGMLERSTEIRLESENGNESSGFLRVVRGYVVYDFLPTSNKIIGVSEDELDNLLRLSPINLLYTGNRQHDLYFNGIQSELIYHGAIGLCVYLFFLMSLYKNNTKMGKCLILLLIAISSMSEEYHSYFVMIILVLAYNQKILENEKDCILHPKRI